MIDARLHKNTKRVLLVYSPLVNVAYLLILALSPDIHSALTQQAFILYVCTIPLLLMLSKLLGMCVWHRAGVVNPAIGPLLMYLTPDGFNTHIGKLSAVLTIAVLALMIRKYILNCAKTA